MLIIKREQFENFRQPIRDKGRESMFRKMQCIEGNEVKNTENEIIVTDKRKRISKIHYTEKNLMKGLTKPSGMKIGFGYNDEDRLNKIEFPGNEVVELKYKGSLLENLVLNGSLLNLKYDEKDRIAEVLYPDGKSTKFKYHIDNHLAAITDRTNASYSFDAIIKNKKLVHRTKDPLGRETSFQLGSMGSVEKINFPDKSTIEIGYDENIEAQVIKQRSGAKQKIYFDGIHAKRIEWADGGYQQIEINPSQQVTALKNNNGTINYEYDAQKRLIKESFGNKTVEYNYEGEYLRSIVYPGGLVAEYSYDEDDRLVTIAIAGEICTFSYALNGTIAEIRYPNRMVESQTSKVMTGLQQTVLVNSNGQTVSTTSYKYDSLSRVTNYTSTAKQSSQKNWGMSYDAEGRLTQILDKTTGKTEVFKYDAKGNLIESEGQKIMIGLLDEIKKVGANHLEYDKNGNLASFLNEKNSQIKLDYTDNCTLKCATLNNAKWEYRYDALGRRISKSNGKETATFFWSGDKLICEDCVTADGTIHRDYIYAGDNTPVAFAEQGRLYWMQKDVRGAVTSLYDQAGVCVWSAVYNAFGKAEISTVKIRQPWRMAGQYYDEETGLHYCFARYYSPYLKTFLSLDPKMFKYGATNYCYAANDPYNRIDVDGNWPEWVSTAGKIVASVAVGVAVGAAVVAFLPAIATAAIGVALEAATVATIALMADAMATTAMQELLDGEKLCVPCILVSALMAPVLGAILKPIMGLVGDAASSAMNKLLPKLPKPNSLIGELIEKGIKVSEKSVLNIGKNSEGRIIFLEKGNAKAGLEHILQKEKNFIDAGFEKGDIGDAIFEATVKGKKIGVQGEGRDVYEIIYKGQPKRIAVTIGDNGFIVGANPVSQSVKY